MAEDSLIPLNQHAKQAGPVRALGIDLGTTNCTVAEVTWDGGSELNVMPLEIVQKTATGDHTHVMVPSVVAIESGRLVVGEGAKRLRARAGELKLDLYRSIFWETKNHIGVKRTYNKAPEGFQSAKEIAAHLLRFLQAAAEYPDAVPSGRTVVTVPASFQFNQRRDTLEAAREAGIDVQPGDLLDEPVAAFLDYLHSNGVSTLGNAGDVLKVVVFDFGGGTCDIALFNFRVPSKGGPLELSPASVSRYHRLGGGDIDAAIVHEVLIPQLIKQNGMEAGDLDFDMKEKFVVPALLGIAEALKVGLCSQIEREIKFDRYEGQKATMAKTQPGQYPVPVKGLGELKLSSPKLTAEQFEEVLEPFLDKDLLYPRGTEFYTSCSIYAPISDGLDRAGWKAGEVTHCLLAGGSSLIPQIRMDLAGYFKNAEILTFEDAEQTQTAIARGAALHAFSLAVRGEGLVVPVAGDTISIRVKGGVHPLIERGTRLPFPEDGSWKVDRSLSVKNGSLAEPVTLRIELVRSDGTTLASKPFKIMPPVSAGDPLELHYRLDDNQRLELRAVYRGAGDPQEQPILIDNPLSNIVNPNEAMDKLADLEEKMRTEPMDQVQRRQTVLEIVKLHRELGQNQKAESRLKYVLQIARTVSEKADALFQLGLLAEQMKNHAGVEKYYEECYRIAGWRGPLFNLTLSYYRRNDTAKGAPLASELVDGYPDGPCFVLQAKIADQAGDAATKVAALEDAFDAFGAVESLDDWELGWYLSACELADKEAEADTARQEQRNRAAKKGVKITTTAEGELPGGPSEISRTKE